MKNAVIGKNTKVERSIIDESVKIGDNVTVNCGEDKPSKYDAKIYSGGLVTIGENSYIPNNVAIGKNVAILGTTVPEDYPNGFLDSGEYIIKAGDAR